MTPQDPNSSLFSQFKSVSPEIWQAKISQDLKGLNPEELNTPTYEGITIKPFYTAADIAHVSQVDGPPGTFPYRRGHKSEKNNWLTIQDIYVLGDSRAAIDRAVKALAGGADGVHFKIEDESAFDLEYLITQIQPAKTTICFTLSHHPQKFIQRYFSLLKPHHISAHGLSGFIALSNPSPMDGISLVSNQLEDTIEYTKEAAGFYGITVNGAQYGNRGATDVQELAFILSQAVCYTDELSGRGFPLEVISRNMQVTVSVGTNYFFQIAKLRALRWLWAGIIKVSEVPETEAAFLRIHAVTSSWYATTFDAHTNLLRATTQGMSAILGGCNSLSVAPFDSTYSEGNAFSERISRNIPLILKHEALLDQVLDPAAGSYYIESLTNELAQKAWALFQEMEANGGFIPALQNGFIQEKINQTTQEKFRNISSGREVLVGSNKFGNKQEKFPFDPETLIQSKQFDATRAAYPFEVMRFAALLHYRKQNQRPKAIIAIIGHDIQEHIHAAFAKEFFDCGDFETEIMSFESARSSLEKLLFLPSKIIVVSGTEADYRLISGLFNDALKKHKQRPVLIFAASPEQMREELEENGFDGYIFQNCNAAQIISRIQEKLLQ